jgi:hypothetical protein
MNASEFQNRQTTPPLRPGHVVIDETIGNRTTGKVGAMGGAYDPVGNFNGPNLYRFIDQLKCHGTVPDISISVIDVLHRNKLRIIMDGRGAWRDNVFAERLWKSVKYEEAYLDAYDSAAKSV